MSEPHSHASGSSASPTVDEGDPPRSIDSFLAYLSPSPGRLANTLRMTGAALFVIVISEIFRIPETALSAYAVFIFFKEDADATTPFALIGAAAITMSAVLSLALFVVDLSQPGLRVPLMAMIAFAAALLSRSGKAGPVLYVAGFLVFYVQTSGDDLMQGALSPSVVSNDTSGFLPEAAFFPPEEALLHNSLYFILAFATPCLVIFLVNRLSERNPADKFRGAIADRLEAAAAFCAGRPGSRGRLVDLAKQGTGSLLKQNEIAAKRHARSHVAAGGEALTDATAHLFLALLAWMRVPAADRSSYDLGTYAATCRDLGRALREETPLPAEHGERVRRDAPEDAARPLVEEIEDALRSLRRALQELHGKPPEPRKKDEARAGPSLLGRLSDPAAVQFALKITLAAMIAYLFLELTDWPSIRTIVTTCFITALATVGQTLHKMMLRICGALVGGALGFLTIILLMPMLTDIGQLLCVLAPVLLAAAWIRTGSERIAYFGQQIAFAFLLTTLQDFGPTLHFQEARDRVVGILLGEIIVFTIFATLWPVTVGDVVREKAAEALMRLADLSDPAQREAPRAERDALRRRFGEAIAGTREVLVNDSYEPAEVRREVGRGVIDASVVTRIQALIVPVSILLRHEAAPAWRLAVPERSRCAADAHQEALAEWLRRFAEWVRTGTGAAGLRDALPVPPAGLPDLARHGRYDTSAAQWAASRHLAIRATWYRILHREIASLLDEIGPDAASVDATAGAAEEERSG